MTDETLATFVRGLTLKSGFDTRAEKGVQGWAVYLEVPGSISGRPTGRRSRPRGECHGTTTGLGLLDSEQCPMRARARVHQPNKSPRPGPVWPGARIRNPRARASQ